MSEFNLNQNRFENFTNDSSRSGNRSFDRGEWKKGADECPFTVESDEQLPSKVNLARNDQSPFWVSMESFFELSFWIAEEIEDLVAEHQIHHVTSPNR